MYSFPIHIALIIPWRLQYKKAFGGLEGNPLVFQSISSFVDTTTIGVNPDLWPAIEKPLIEAKFFILLASPKSANSYWVNKEVETWFNSRDRLKAIENFIIVVTDGSIKWNDSSVGFDKEVTNCLPDRVLEEFRSEPKWVDFRPLRNRIQYSMDNPKFKSLVADISTYILRKRGVKIGGELVSKEALIDEDVRQVRRRRRFLRLALGVSIVLFLATAVSLVFALFAQSGMKREQTRLLSIVKAQESRALFETDPKASMLAAEKAYFTFSPIEQAVYQNLFYVFNEFRDQKYGAYDKEIGRHNAIGYHVDYHPNDNFLVRL